MAMELIHLQNKQSSPEITILGYGAYGRALAQSFDVHSIPFAVGTNQKEAGQDPLNERRTETPGNNVIGPHGTFETYADAVIGPQVIFLAVPAHAYESVIEPIKSHLEGKTVVDVSNLEKKTDAPNATRLQAMIPASFVVKALNTVSAYTLEQAAYGASRDTYVCGDNKTSKDVVIQVLREIGLNPIDRGTLKSATAVEKLPFQLFPGWGRAFVITIMTMIPIWLYSYLHIFWYNSDAVDHAGIGLYEANRIIAWTMFWVLGLVYLPGVLAGFIQIFRGSKYSQFPTWLDAWLKCRKQLGLICLLMASIHACASCLLMGSGELKNMVNIQPVNSAVSNTPVLFPSPIVSTA